jgi:hypothetical protein
MAALHTARRPRQFVFQAALPTMSRHSHAAVSNHAVAR